MKILIFLFILIPSIAFAEQEIVFTTPDTLYTAVQRGSICQKQFSLQTEKLQVVESLVLTLEKENSVYVEQITILDKKIGGLTSFITKQDSTILDLTNLLQTQKEGYEDLINLQKPTFLQKLKDSTLMVGIGFILGVVATIAQ